MLILVMTLPFLWSALCSSIVPEIALDVVEFSVGLDLVVLLVVVSIVSSGVVVPLDMYLGLLC